MTETEIERMVGAMTSTGVYCIECIDNGRRYIGSCASSRGIKNRLKGHIQSLMSQSHHNQHLQRAWNKYGETRFKFNLLECCDPVVCITREQHWIDTFDSANPKCGFNICPTAGSRFGAKYTDASKRKISLANKRRSPESRKKHADKLRGRKHTKEHKEAISVGGKRAWKENPHLPHSEEAKYRMGGATRGKKSSSERIAKMLETRASRTYTYSSEVRQKMSVAAKKRGITKETKEKINLTIRSPAGRLKASESAKRRGISTETRAKMVAARWPHIYGEV